MTTPMAAPLPPSTLRRVRRPDPAPPPGGPRAAGAFAKLKPMLAVLADDLPAEQRHYAFEFKWDGMRGLARCDGRRLRLMSRNGIDATDRFPELAPLADAIGRPAILDGEIVALDEAEHPSFARLQQRMHVSDARVARQLAKTVPVQLVLFDVLAVDDEWVIDRPWTERRAMLEELTVKGPTWELSPAVVGRGDTVLATARAHELEGVVAKRLDSTYQLDRRSPDWLKIKLVQRQEFVIGGWTAERGGTDHSLGSILVGYYDCAGGPRPKLRYAGSVGTGFNARSAGAMLAALRRISADVTPFADPIPRGGRWRRANPSYSPRDVRFVRPEIVVEVEYRRWPAGGLIQQASFKGVRADKDAREVVKEARG